MKNFEKYIDAISRRTCLKSILNFDDCCKECDFGDGNGTCDDAKVKQWLLEEYKEPIKLSHDEYVILKNLSSELKYITRDEDGELNVFKTKPSKNLIRKDEKGAWASFVRVEFEEFDKPCLKYVCYDLDLFSHLFQLIQWSDDEPYEIAKLIDDYEKEHEDETNNS